jgi:hypothetical protein
VGPENLSHDQIYGNTGRAPYRDLALADVSTDDEEPMQSFPFTERERGTLLHGIAASLFLPLNGDDSAATSFFYGCLCLDRNFHRRIC